MDSTPEDPSLLRAPCHERTGKTEAVLALCLVFCLGLKPPVKGFLPSDIRLLRRDSLTACLISRARNPTSAVLRLGVQWGPLKTHYKEIT